MNKILILTGTRPEIIKMSPLIQATKKENLLYVHTGQHYDYNLSLQFIEELSLPSPHYNFRLNSIKPSLQISEIIEKLQKVIDSTKPSVLCVQGDTNSVLAASICALKNKIPIAHVEAGLRSRDWRMQEEHNRIVVDHISDLLFTPTQSSKTNLTKEHVYGKIFVVGNTIIDAIEQNLPMALKKSKLDIEMRDFILVTMHRAENVDNPITLSNLAASISNSSLPVIFPIHPRTKSNLKKFGLLGKLLHAKNVTLIPPVGYFDFLKLMKLCKFIVSDSGGIQEEATSPSIRKFVIVVRKTTDRPEAANAGFARVVGTDSKNIKRAIAREILSESGRHVPSNSPYGNGNSAKKILKIIYKSYIRN